MTFEESIKVEKTQKTIRFENDLRDKIQALADNNRRDFAKQVKYMCEKYLEITESK